jgi:hypothetical protein
MNYVKVLHPLFFLGRLYAHEQLWTPRVRTKVANRAEPAVVSRLGRYRSDSCLPTKLHNLRRYTNGELKRLEGRNPGRERL